MTSLQARSITQHDAEQTQHLPGNPPPQLSPRVIFSAPTQPPAELASQTHDVTAQNSEATDTNNDAIDDNETTQYDTGEDTDTDVIFPHAIRHKRNVRHHGGEFHPCSSVSRYRRRSWALDAQGNNLTVLHEYDMMGTQASQLFHETWCDESANHNNVQCEGIDHTRYRSCCKTAHTLHYAYVQDRHGNKGWRQVYLQTGCNCVIRHKHHRQDISTNSVR